MAGEKRKCGNFQRYSGKTSAVDKVHNCYCVECRTEFDTAQKYCPLCHSLNIKYKEDPQSSAT